MNTTPDISARMDTIRNIFQKAQDGATDQQNDQTLIASIEQLEARFRSVAYEGAAMMRAIDDIENEDTLTRWTNFRDQLPHHAVQVHIGLGWALSQKKQTDISVLDIIAPLMRARVLDGYGYCDGTFRQRLSIRTQKIPDHITDEMLHGYDQGLGRSLWYISKGNMQDLFKLIDSFQIERQRDLWRGVGIAITYVGGCDETTLREIFTHASHHSISLAVGAALAARSRADGGSLDIDTDIVCNTWCHLSAIDTAQLAIDSKPSSITHPDNTFSIWIDHISAALKENFNKK